MIYFVRHGATPWNDNLNAQGQKDPKCQGRVDLELNEKGIEQAKLAGQALKGIKFDRVICSPLKRAKQTCDLISDEFDVVEYDSRVIERDFGEFEGLTRSEFDFKGFWNLNSNQKFKKAESIKDVEKRVFSLLDELRKNPEENVLIVSHGGVGCVAMTYFYGIPEDKNYLSFEIPNGKPLILDFEKIQNNDKKV